MKYVYHAGNHHNHKNHRKKNKNCNTHKSQYLLPIYPVLDIVICLPLLYNNSMRKVQIFASLNNLK